MQVLCLYGPKKSKPRVKSELRKQQKTVTLSDCDHLAQVIVDHSPLANKKNRVTEPFLLCFKLYLRANSQYKHPGGGGGRRLNGGFFELRVGGAYFRNFTVRHFNINLVSYHHLWPSSLGVGRLNGGCFELRVGGAYFRNFTVCHFNINWVSYHHLWPSSLGVGGGYTD